MIVDEKLVTFPKHVGVALATIGILNDRIEGKTSSVLVKNYADEFRAAVEGKGAPVTPVEFSSRANPGPRAKVDLMIAPR